AALELLGGAEHPAALTVIERAIHDEDPRIRQRALEALGRQDANQALPALSHAAIDQAAPWDARLNAIQRLGTQPAPAAAAQLAACARDAALPLYVRIRAVGALGRHADGMSQLIAAAADASCHPEVRAAAARQIGAGDHHAAIEDLLRLLDH